LGSTPDLWLRPGTIDAIGNVVPAMQAYVVYYMAERINATEEANSQREKMILDGCRFAVWAPVVLAIGAVSALALEPRTASSLLLEVPV
jgi:hypothetical protein